MPFYLIEKTSVQSRNILLQLRTYRKQYGNIPAETKIKLALILQS